MSMKTKKIIDRVSRELVDPRNVRWFRSELIQYLSEAVGVIAARQPGLFAKSKDISVTQCPISIPDDGFSLLGVNSIDGISAQYVLIEKLDQMYPRWRLDKGEPNCWTKSDYDPKHFWIYPQPSSSVTVSILYAQDVKITDESGDITIPNIYEGALVDFVMYRAYSRDGENTSEANKAQQHFQSFMLFMNDDSTLKENRNVKLDQVAFK